MALPTSIPSNLGHLDELTPDGLSRLIIREILRQSPDHQLIKGCINAGAPLDARSFRGWTALHYAAVNGYLEIAQALIDAGASIDAQNTEGETPLHKAAINFNTHSLWTQLHEGRLEIIQHLLKAGASKEIMDNYGKTPWDYAKSSIRNLCPELQP